MVGGGRRALKGGQNFSSWRSGRGVPGAGKGVRLCESPGHRLGSEEGMAMGREALAVELYTQFH